MIKGKVYLDGILQTGCIEAHPDEGYIIRFKKHKNTRHVIENAVFVREKVYGKVEVVPHED